MNDHDQDLRSLLQLALDKSVEGREELTARIAQLSLEREHMLSDQERDLIFDILDKLIPEFEVPIRKRLADRTSRNPAAPRSPQTGRAAGRANGWAAGRTPWGDG